MPTPSRWPCVRHLRLAWNTGGSSGLRATFRTCPMIFSSSQADGNSVFPGLPVPCRCPPPQRSPSRMCRARSGATCSESSGGRSGWPPTASTSQADRVRAVPRQVQPCPSRPSVDPWRAMPRSIPRGRVLPRAAYRPGDRRLADRPRALSPAGNLRPVPDRRHARRRGRRSPPGSPLAAALTLHLAPRLSAAVARPAPPPRDGIWLGRRSPPPTPERAGRQGAPVSHARHRALARVIWCGVRQDTRIRSGLATMIASALAREVATFSRCPS